MATALRSPVPTVSQLPGSLNNLPLPKRQGFALIQVYEDGEVVFDSLACATEGEDDAAQVAQRRLDYFHGWQRDEFGRRWRMECREIASVEFTGRKLGGKGGAA